MAGERGVEGAVTPAATVVPLRDGAEGIEVLMLRRNGRGPFGGMWVFPGGKIDPADWGGDPGDWAVGPAGSIVGPARQEEEKGRRVEAAAEVEAARRAAVREAAEEASLRLDPDTLVVHSWWLPPPEAPRRFATWFFLASVGDAPEVVVDGTEIYEHRWFTVAAAFAARDRGEMAMAPPTWMTLWWIGHHKKVAAALAASAARPLGRFETRMHQVGDHLVGLWAGDVAYESGDIEASGARRRLWMTAPSWWAEVNPFDTETGRDPYGDTEPDSNLN